MCIFFLLSSFFFLSCVIVGNGSGCFLEVVLHPQVRRVGIWISGQPSNVICTEEERNTNKREQRHRAVFVESAYIRVVSSVQNIVCDGCSFFPYFSIPATPKEQ